MSTRSDIPFGAQFSPNQVDLVGLLNIIHTYAGNRTRITEAIRDTFFTSQAPDQRWTLADNCVLAMRAYALIDEDGATPTELAHELNTIAGDRRPLYEAFARHILINLRGIALVETILAMQTAGEEITLHTLHQQLEQRGLQVPRGAVHLSSMRLWLAQAEVFDPTVSSGARLYQVDQARLNSILGIGLDEIEQLTNLNRSQRSFLRALVRIAEPDPHIANEVADLATALYSVQFNHKELPQSVLFPLRELGYIEVMKSTEGRGAKPYKVVRTAKFNGEISDPILSTAAERAKLVPVELFKRPLKDILHDLKSEDRYIKGRGLELLAIYFTRLIDLDFKGWRVRSADTGGAEVDAIVEGARLIFSRWQIQAKNTSIVRLDDIAKEVGLALTFTYSNVVMVVTTGKFTRDAYNYATHVMRTSNLNVITLNGAELDRLSHDPMSIVELLTSKAQQAMQIKARTDYFSAE